jgi:hypothetical protein
MESPRLPRVNGDILTGCVLKGARTLPELDAVRQSEFVYSADWHWRIFVYMYEWMLATVSLYIYSSLPY